ncbi:MAG: aminotransferase class I/II-fold pyridoxal phosphate-dependent enzyme [Gemmatimonadetes bacterium]|uniref:Aminotransferase class I/II-fold pyridoxal phosphate-dependent enzyme n=1 Tax=Candidatus Kutchimonas denitrificans TaxID=3056748 RepID=A0AAE5CCY6_9BACT|nr:aminotransferase class I/II-fold pyridoxal phosphate-dependent enzyme [Gemmatimonadota bacterium]NIR76290.1 aminotransferase class I/II-fold pyridoxal phosphate-dependent enzyme [Candidatus Kutchimonas denitrificans]NIS02313.1 aminotransferase class I/II-fold pyridoxal phosphate-dependent enzyme [Gemmatimonadota bacterium]NIT68132.1 aminotransferase class I/II-fold pyridoxal phosphate-dependent enzyme [Gemmatimonadota bacterium]NIU54356.1 aminotransferase class V-fold PLP-dependent enzyme [G
MTIRKPKSREWGMSTRVIRSVTGGGAAMGPGGGTSLTAPIWQSSTFEFHRPEEVADAATATQPETFYTRYGNPNFSAVQTALAELEGGEAALVTGSGMAAIMLVFLGMLKNGDHLVSQNCHYVGTMKALESWLPRYGIEVTMVDQTDLDAFADAMRPNTRLVMLETPTNPTLTITDLAGVMGIARDHDAFVCMDNTFATPINQRPLEHGIDLVVHSATKYLGGHSDLTAGFVVGRKELIDELWLAHIIHGGISHPFEAWLLGRGLQTLPFRVARHNSSAMAVAEFLEGHAAIERVYYPGLASHPQHELAAKQMDGFGGMVVFELAGGFDAARDFTARLELARRAVSLGGTETLAVHAASMIHARLTPAQRAEAGISENLIRVSVGLEDPEDIVADFERALR